MMFDDADDKCDTKDIFVSCPHCQRCKQLQADLAAAHAELAVLRKAAELREAKNNGVGWGS